MSITDLITAPTRKKEVKDKRNIPSAPHDVCVPRRRWSAREPMESVEQCGRGQIEERIKCAKSQPIKIISIWNNFRGRNLSKK